MAQNKKILIIEDDPIFQEISAAVFAAYQLKIVATGEMGVEIVPSFLPDLIVLDIDLPGIDGYETCQQLRADSLTAQTPILFISEYTGLNDRLKAYGAGGDDYFTKPINNQEVIVKVEKFLALQKKQAELAEQLNDSYSIVLGMQSTAAYLQTISRFLINMLYCHNMDDIAAIFFKAAKGMNINCILRIQTDEQTVLQSTTGTITQLEHEILDLSSSLDRIYSFGNNRAIFTWHNATVLIRNLDDKIDILAILMDGMEAGIKAVIQQQKLLEMVSEVDQGNAQVGGKITDLCGDMGLHLQETFLSLGLSFTLSLEEEAMLNEEVNRYTTSISGELSTLQANNKKIAFLVNELNTLSNDEQSLAANPADDEVDDGIEFF
ncbi:MAG: response regulator [Methyloprofundus sp.]|nr:response regulator [Methyloprofundus sp.]